MNARYLERLGFGTAALALDEAALERFLEREPVHGRRSPATSRTATRRRSPPSTASARTNSRPDGAGERPRARAHAAPLCLGVRARRNQGRDRRRLRLGRAPADLVAKPRCRGARLRRRDGPATAHGLSRLGLHGPGRRPAPSVRHGRPLDACGGAAHAGDLLRARRRLGLPLVRAQSGVHGGSLRARQGLVVRGAVVVEVPARLLHRDRRSRPSSPGSRPGRPATPSRSRATSGCSPGWRSWSR